MTEDERARCLKSGVEVHGAENRLQRVHQDCSFVAPAALFFSPAQAQIPSELEAFGCMNQVILANQMSAQFRKLPFTEFGKATKQFFCRDQTQDRIPQELKLLVIGDALGNAGTQRLCLSCL